MAKESWDDLVTPLSGGGGGSSTTAVPKSDSWDDLVTPLSGGGVSPGETAPAKTIDPVAVANIDKDIARAERGRKNIPPEAYAKQMEVLRAERAALRRGATDPAGFAIDTSRPEIRNDDGADKYGSISAGPEPGFWGDTFNSLVAGTKDLKKTITTAIGGNDAEKAARLWQLERETPLPSKKLQDAQRKLAAVQEDPVEAARVLAENPMLIWSTSVRSLVSSSPSLVLGALGSVVGPAGTAAGAFIGSASTEYAAALVEAMTENGSGANDPQLILAAMRNPELMAKAREKAVKRGLAVGTFDALTAGLAGKLLLGAKKSVLSVGSRVAGEVGLQAAGGATGEATAQKWADGKVHKWGDVWLEAFAEMPSAVVEAPANIRHARDVGNRREANKILDETLAAAAKAGSVEEAKAIIKAGTDKIAKTGNQRTLLERMLGIKSEKAPGGPPVDLTSGVVVPPAEPPAPPPAGSTTPGAPAAAPAPTPDLEAQAAALDEAAVEQQLLGQLSQEIAEEQGPGSLSTPTSDNAIQPALGPIQPEDETLLGKLGAASTGAATTPAVGEKSPIPATGTQESFSPTPGAETVSPTAVPPVPAAAETTPPDSLASANQPAATATTPWSDLTTPLGAEPEVQPAPPATESDDDRAIREEVQGFLGAVFEGAGKSNETPTVPVGAVRTVAAPSPEAQQFVAAVEQALGIKISFVEANEALIPKTLNGKPLLGEAGFDGFVLPIAGASRIFLNAKAKTPINFVVGHELVHLLRNKHPDIYEALKAAIWKEAKGFNKRGAAKVHGRKGALLEEEILADYVGRRWQEQEFYNGLADAMPVHFGKLYKVWSALLTKLSEALRRYAADSDWIRAPDVAKEYIDRAFVMWAREHRKELGLAAAVQAQQASPAQQKQSVAQPAVAEKQSEQSTGAAAIPPAATGVAPTAPSVVAPTPSKAKKPRQSKKPTAVEKKAETAAETAPAVQATVPDERSEEERIRELKSLAAQAFGGKMLAKEDYRDFGVAIKEGRIDDAEALLAEAIDAVAEYKAAGIKTSPQRGRISDAIRQGQRLSEAAAGRRGSDRRAAGSVARGTDRAADAEGTVALRSRGDRGLGDVVELRGHKVKPVATIRSGLSTVGYEINDPKVFHDLISRGAAEHKFGTSVYIYDVGDYADMRMFISKTGTAGVAVKKNGDMVSVFKSDLEPGKYTSTRLLRHAINNAGARKADCFATILPDLYGKLGFRVVARTKWDDQWAPPKWDKKLYRKFQNGEPDIAYLVYDPKHFFGSIKEWLTVQPSIPYSRDMDDANAVQQDVMDRIDEIEKTVKGSERDMLADEIPKVQRGAPARKLVELLESAPSADEMVSVSLAGQAKRGWYQRSALAIAEVFGDEAPRFAALLAALSPQTSVQQNLYNALAVWRGWKEAGSPVDEPTIASVIAANVQGSGSEESVLLAWRNNSLRALQSPNPGRIVLSGPKVNSFMRNLLGYVDEVTNDAWMAAYGLVSQRIFGGAINKEGTLPGKRYGYIGMSVRVREAARKLTKLTGEEWTPAEVQETVWSWTKAAYEVGAKQGSTWNIARDKYGVKPDDKRTIAQLVRDGVINDELINEVPDFSELFNEDNYRFFLEEAGYTARLDRLGDIHSRVAAFQKPSTGGQAGKAAPKAARLAKAASRLDRLLEIRREEERTGKKSKLSEIIIDGLEQQEEDDNDTAMLSRARGQTETPAFKKWFGASKVVDRDGRPLVVYHGTTADFTEFDMRRAGLENDLGAGFYFSSSQEDAGSSYGTDTGGDLEIRLQRYIDIHLTDTDVFSPDMNDEQWKEIAKEALGLVHKGVVMPVFLSLQNPVVLGGKDATFFDYNIEYDEEGDIIGEPTGRLVEFIEALKDRAEHFEGGEIDSAIGKLLERGLDNGGLTAQEAVNTAKAYIRYVYDPDTHSEADAELIRLALERMGFDGIIDRTVNRKFGTERKGFGGARIPGMPGIDRDTAHYIAFEPTQIKSATGNVGTFSREDANILFSPSRGTTAPIFYSELARQIQQAKMNEMPAQQWQSWLAANGPKLGIKRDEIVWSGIEEYLRLRGKDRVPKSELVAFLDEDGVKVGETMYAEVKKDKEEQIQERGLLDRRAELESEKARILDENNVREPWNLSTAAGAEYVFINQQIDEINEELTALAHRRLERSSASAPRYSNYALEGGDDYRELLMTLPEIQPKLPAGWTVQRTYDPIEGTPRRTYEWEVRDTEGDQRGIGHTAQDAIRDAATAPAADAPHQPNYYSGHWENVPNIITHIRFDQRSAPTEGKRVLFIQEFQSDWAQKGKREGFGITGGETQLTLPGIELAGLERSRAGLKKGVPRAPFVEKTEAWVALAIKRMIRFAAEQGIDVVAWTTGEQQANRYDLSKHVQRLAVRPLKRNGRYVGGGWRPGKVIGWRLIGTHPSGRTVISRDLKDLGELDEYIGKEPAQRLRAGTEGGTQEFAISGLDLKVGGTGMVAFYDQIVPQVANDVLKKLGGGRVREVTLPNPDTTENMTQLGFDITPKMAERALDSGLPLFSRPRGVSRGTQKEVVRQYRQGVPVTQIATNTKLPQPVVLTLLQTIGNRWNMNVPPIGVAPGRQPFNLPEETFAQRWQRRLQDSMNRAKLVETAVVEQGGVLTDTSDFYLAAERMPGIASAEMERFADSVVKPLVKAARDAKVTLEDAAMLAYAIHAPERNAQIAKINPNNPDKGSGLTDAEAAQIVANYQQRPDYQQLLAITNRIFDVGRETLNTLEAQGLIDPQEAANLRGYKNWVPLRGGDMGATAGELNVPAWKDAAGGYDVRGGETHRALGRMTPADPKGIIANLVNDRYAAILRAEKNRVGKALLEFVADNPDQTLWVVNEVKWQQTLTTDPVTKQQIVEWRPSEERGPETISVKVSGREFYIHVRDPLLARQLLEMGVERLPRGLQFYNKINAWLSQAYTALSPTFVAVNFFRDLWTASVHSLNQAGLRRMARTWTYIPAAIKAIYRDERGKQHRGQMAIWYDDYLQAGVRTGFAQMLPLQDRVKQIEALYRDAGRGVLNPLRVWHVTRDWIMDVNAAVENATRLAAYRAARENGQNRVQAASYAKNLTVNFNRRGELTPWLSAAYLFFNPAVQGTATIIRNMKEHPERMVAMTTAMVGLGFIAAMVGSMDDDDDGTPYWDKIGDWDKQRNLIIRTPGSGEFYIKVPIPYGYNVFFNLGYAIADMVRMSEGRSKKQLSTVSAEIATSVLDAYSPIAGSRLFGSQQQFIGSIMPTVPGQVGVQLAANINAFGQQIVPEHSGNKEQPDATKMRPGTKGSAAEHLTTWANKLTGGDAAYGGLVDVSPETVKFLFTTITGGLGSFVAGISDFGVKVGTGTFKPEEDLHNVPFFRQAYGKVDITENAALYYENYARLAKATQAYKDFLKAGDREGAQQLFDGKEQLRLWGNQQRGVQKALADLKRQEFAVRSEDVSTPERVARLREIERKRMEIYKEFNRAFYERGGADLP